MTSRLVTPLTAHGSFLRSSLRVWFRTRLQRKERLINGRGKYELH